MKNTIKQFGIIALMAILIFSMVACDPESDNKSGGTTYAVTYNGNGSTGGTVPTDSTSYSSGATVTVLGQGTLVKAGYSFTGWNTAANGSGTAYEADATFTISANTTLYAQWQFDPNYQWQIGDTSPTGGIIFYYSASGFTMTGIDGTCHYLEVSPANLTGGTGSQTEMRWSTATDSPYPATDGILETIGSGKNNTAIIIAAESAAYPSNTYIYAARACSEYRGGGKDDWFLPSIDVLSELRKANNILRIGGTFWSSSEYPADPDNYARAQNMSSNSINPPKRAIYSVRAVRAF